ncbi:MAG: EpsG family protein [Muribaculaceae bacterium]|nr:EpsG family protein [Muribaculaceae bacterium]
MIYFIALLLILIGIYRYDYCKVRHGRLLLWVILCILLICIAGFRYRLGGDTLQYESFFRKVPALADLRLHYFQDIRYAPGFVILGSLSKTIYNDVMVLQFAEALIVDTVVFYFFWKNTRHIYFAALLFYILMYLNLNMEIMREAISVSFFLLAWPFILRGQWLKYYIMVGCAMLFHVSAFALLVLPLIFLPGLRYFFTFDTRTWIFGAICLLLGFTASYFFFNFIKAIAVTETMVDRANIYSDSDFGGLRTLNIVGLFSRLVRYVFYPALAIYFINKAKGKSLFSDDKLQKIEILSVASIYVSLLSSGIFIFQRYNNYLLFFPLIMMSDCVFTVLNVGYRKVRLGFLSWMLVFLPMFALSFYTFYFNPVNKEGTLMTYMRYYPYKDGFNKEMDPEREKMYYYFRKKR